MAAEPVDELAELLADPVVAAAIERADYPTSDPYADFLIDCPTCGAGRDFDDPADCPDCAGERQILGSCERGTDGCSIVHHGQSSSCESW